MGASPTTEEGLRQGLPSPPHPTPNEAARTAAKALLENFGFELVIQYNGGKQAVPLTLGPHPQRPWGRGQAGLQGLWETLPICLSRAHTRSTCTAAFCP